MRLKDPPKEAKHIHPWRLVEQRPAPAGVWAQRRCDDCRLDQTAYILSRDVVPSSVLQLAEAEWSNGELPKAWSWYQP